MPYKRKYNKRRPARRPRYLATKPKFVPRGLAAKKYHGVQTKTFYFKTNGYISTGGTGASNVIWANQRWTPPSVQNFPNIGADFERVARLYREYKVLGGQLKLFPSNVGTESDAPGISLNPFNRGNCVVYNTQNIERNTQAYTAIDQVMNLGSAKMIRPRARYTRNLFRPKGNPEWGNCDEQTPQVNRDPDSWWGSINLVINDATPNIDRVFFWTLSWKVIFRTRDYDSVGLQQFELLTLTP